LNPKTGAYSDAWGTPFFLRVSDKDGIEIRSFGPNRKDDGGGNDDLALAIPFAKDVRQPETGASPLPRPKR